MKKYRIISYAILIIVITVMSIILYQNISKGKENNMQEKALSEIEFLDLKIVGLINEMNKIEMRNYNLSVSEISKSIEESKSQNEEKSSSSEESSSKSESNGGEQDNSQSTSGGDEEQNKKFNLKSAGVLSTKEAINWEYVKNEIEILYETIPTITIDLYNLNVNQEDILGFNSDFDELAKVIKKEEKEETLVRLTKVYEYIPKFTTKVSSKELDKIVTEAKLNLFKAYSLLDSKNWEEITSNIQQMTDTYSKLLTDTSLDQSKQYTVSKVYVMINELQNAIKVQDESIFLIKYKNILEEMNQI